MSWERTKSVRCDNKDEHGGHYYDEFGKTWLCPGVPKELVSVLEQWDRIEADSFIPQKDVPVTKGFGGPVLGKCETFVDEEGNLCVKAELNAAGYKLLGLPIDTTARLSVPELEE